MRKYAQYYAELANYSVCKINYNLEINSSFVLLENKTIVIVIHWSSSHLDSFFFLFEHRHGSLPQVVSKTNSALSHIEMWIYVLSETSV